MTGKALSELTSSHAASEKAEEVCAEVGFALKFKKMRADKTPLTVRSAKDLVARAAAALTDLLESSKALKALVPAKPSSST